LKNVSGRLLRRDRPDIAVRYYYKGVLWSPGYFASSCGGAPISVIRQYIEQQQTPGQVENRALYPRPEGRGFTAHRINSPHGINPLNRRFLRGPVIKDSSFATQVL
ncbi:transposase, partial [Escherichia coli]